jgi:integrase
MDEELRTPHRIGEVSFTDAEIDLLTAKAETLEEELMLALELALALRREDAAGVLVENIDLPGSRLTYVEHKKHVKKKEGGRIVDKGSRIRTVFIGPRLRQAIVKYLNATGKKKSRLFGCTGKTLYNWLQSMCDRAKIPHRKFHAFRATSIKRHLKAGWTIAQVCALTFDSPRVIETYYTVPSLDEMRELTETHEVM